MKFEDVIERYLFKSLNTLLDFYLFKIMYRLEKLGEKREVKVRIKQLYCLLKNAISVAYVI
jgi:hypothetical protein